MPNERDDIERLQRETNEALERLTLELRENRPAASTPGATTGESRLEAQPLREVSDALGRTTGALQQLTDGLGANASALRSAAEAFSSGGEGLLAALASGLGDGGSGWSSIVRGGFGLAPAANALLGLFRGGGREREEEPVLEPVVAPAPIRLEGALTNGRVSPFVRGAGDEVRVVETRPAAPQVVVNVSAMDSQSFLTRSHDIARAVRDAMLHMDPLNDVIGEL